jgi:hypothetical protein
MIFKHEFEIAPDEFNLQYFEWCKKRGALDIGRMIGEKFLYEEAPYRANNWRLELQIFPREEWLKFKEGLKQYIEFSQEKGLSTFNLIMIGNMLKELEDFGQQKSETIPPPTE